jgi:hypothetical protein
VLSIAPNINKLYKKRHKLSVVAHTCNPGAQETEAGESKVQGQLGLHSETLSENKNEYR